MRRWRDEKVDGGREGGEDVVEYRYVDRKRDT